MPEKTWQPKVAGILMIIDGVIFMLTVLLLLFLGAIYTHPHYPLGQEPSQSELQMQFIRKSLTGLIGIFPIVSGVFCLKRRFWGFAVAGATLAMVPLVPIWWYLFLPTLTQLPASYNVFIMVAIVVMFIVTAVLITPFILLLRSRKEFKR